MNKTWIKLEPGSSLKICSQCRITLTNKKIRWMFCLCLKLRRKIPVQQTFSSWKLSVEKLGKIMNIFKVKKKDTGMLPLMLRCLYCKLWKYFAPFYSISIDNFEQANVCRCGVFVVNFDAFNLLIKCFYFYLKQVFVSWEVQKFFKATFFDI